MAGTPFKDGPTYLTDSAANIYVPSAATIYALVRHIHLVNTDASARTVDLFVGATGGSAAGTEILEDYSIAANDVYDLYFPAGLKLTSADYLTGLASVTNVVVCTVTGELYAA
jgi:hypothetical protein